MSKIKEYQDLCSTCNHALTCVRLKSIKRPVWFCEEFDDYTPPPPKEVGKDIVQSEEEKYDRSMGLCYNCAKRDTCTFVKPNGGVWHCEEYC